MVNINLSNISQIINFDDNKNIVKPHTKLCFPNLDGIQYVKIILSNESISKDETTPKRFAILSHHFGFELLGDLMEHFDKEICHLCFVWLFFDVETYKVFEQRFLEFFHR